MKTFNTIDEAWIDAIHTICHDGEETINSNVHGDTLEVIGHSFRLRPGGPLMLRNTSRKLSPSYACAELLWYLSMTDKADMIKHYAPQWSKWTDADGTIFGAYGSRWADDKNLGMTFDGTHYTGVNQLHLAIKLLRRRPATKQCVMTCWNAGDLAHALVADKGSLPCTCTLQFLIRGGKLHLSVYMRSNDLWFGTPYDVFSFASLQRIVAGELGVEIGDYIHTVGSLHIYRRDMVKIMACTRPAAVLIGGWRVYDPPVYPQLGILNLVLGYERNLREEIGNVPLYLQRLQHDAPAGILVDALAVLAQYHLSPEHRFTDYITDPSILHCLQFSK